MLSLPVKMVLPIVWCTTGNSASTTAHPHVLIDTDERKLVFYIYLLIMFIYPFHLEVQTEDLNESRTKPYKVYIGVYLSPHKNKLDCHLGIKHSHYCFLQSCQKRMFPDSQSSTEWGSQVYYQHSAPLQMSRKRQLKPEARISTCRKIIEMCKRL